MALKIGLMSPMRATTASPELAETCKKIVDKIGEFPHDRMIIKKVKTQGTRNIKVSCLCCDFSFRTSQKNIDKINLRTCLSCETEDAVTIV